MVSPERRASESEKSDLPDGVTVNARQICKICGGRAKVSSVTGALVHVYEEDWADNPHNVELADA